MKESDNQKIWGFYIFIGLLILLFGIQAFQGIVLQEVREPGLRGRGDILTGWEAVRLGIMYLFACFVLVLVVRWFRGFMEDE